VRFPNNIKEFQLANRYTYQFNGSYKPKMSQIEGFVSIGTGGLINYPDQSGLGTPSGGSVQTGLPRGLLPGQATAGVPTGWQGGFSGTIGLLKAGVAGVARIATGLYSVLLEDDWVRLDSVQVEPCGGGIAVGAGGQTGATSISAQVLYHTVGLGNTVTTGFQGASGLVGLNLKNQIVIEFYVNSVNADLPASSGFFLSLRLRDSFAGCQ
jgi:hypothetical protein